MAKKANIAFANLRAEMGRYEMSVQDMADAMNEAFEIAKLFPTNNDVRFLFQEAS